MRPAPPPHRLTHNTCMLLLVLVFYGALVVGVLAEARRGVPAYMKFMLCMTPLQLLNFDCSGNTWRCLCQYMPMRQLLVLCWEQMADNETELKEIVRRALNHCGHHGHTLAGDSIDQWLADGTNTTVPFLNATLATGTIHQPVHIDSSTLNRYYTAYDAFYYSLDMGPTLAGMVLVYWGFVLALLSIGHFVRCSGLARHCTGAVLNTWRKYVAIPALFNKKHTQLAGTDGWFTTTLLPTRLEGVILLGYLAVVVVVNAIHFRFTADNILYPLRRLQILRYAGDRTGFVALAHIPFIIATAGRNNILQWLTGLTYLLFIQFHKAIARGMLANVLAHTGLFLWYYLEVHGLKARAAMAAFRWAVTATSVGCVMVFFAQDAFRYHCYETFLWIHIVLGVGFIIGVWHHILSFGWMEWMYASIAIWALDRALRLFRMATFGFPKATIRFVSGHTFKVTIPRPAHWKAFPGAYGYLTFVTKALFIQSHPFSLCDSVCDENTVTVYIQTKGGLTRSMRERLNRLPTQLLDIRVTLEGPYGSPTPASKYDNVLLIAGGNGIPGMLAHAVELARANIPNQYVRLVWSIRNMADLEWFLPELKQLSGGKVDVQIYLTRCDPPAVKGPAVKPYEKPLPSLPKQEPIHSIQSLNSLLDTLGAVPSANRENYQTFLRNFSSLSAQTLNDCETLEVGLYSTSLNDSGMSAAPLYLSDHTRTFEPREAHTFEKQLWFATFHYGRPDFGKLLPKDFIAATGLVAVVTCGAPAMCDDIRRIVALSLDRGHTRVDLFEELQAW